MRSTTPDMPAKVIAHVKNMQRDLRRVEEVIIPKAARSGLAAGVRKFNTETVRAVAARTGVPQKVLRPKNVALKFGSSAGSNRKMGGRVRPFFPSRGRLTGGIDAVWFPVDAIRLGRAKQNKSGTRAGSRSFPGAFIATMPNNKTGIFKRRGKARLPIEKQTIKLNPDADRIAEVKMVRVGRRTAIREFERQAARMLKRR